MCHGQAVTAFPAPVPGAPFDGAVSGYIYGDETAASRIAVLPDIYGCNPFYQGLCAHFAARGARVFLVDTFAGLGDLPEMTREAAFARRGRVRDRDFLDRFQTFAAGAGVTGVIGFCLGGLYVFELARRGMEAALVGLYGFPQGLPNQDPLPVPFDYLPDVRQPHLMLLGREDVPVGADTIARLEDMAASVPALSLTIYEGVGHDFLPLLDSDDAGERAAAEDALAACEAALL